MTIRTSVLSRTRYIRPKLPKRSDNVQLETPTFSLRTTHKIVAIGASTVGTKAICSIVCARRGPARRPGPATRRSGAYRDGIRTR